MPLAASRGARGRVGRRRRACSVSIRTWVPKVPLDGWLLEDTQALASDTSDGPRRFFAHRPGIPLTWSPGWYASDATAGARRRWDARTTASDAAGWRGVRDPGRRAARTGTGVGRATARVAAPHPLGRHHPRAPRCDDPVADDRLSPVDPTLRDGSRRVAARRPGTARKAVDFQRQAAFRWAGARTTPLRIVQRRPCGAPRCSGVDLLVRR